MPHPRNQIRRLQYRRFPHHIRPQNTLSGWRFSMSVSSWFLKLMRRRLVSMAQPFADFSNPALRNDPRPWRRPFDDASFAIARPLFCRGSEAPGIATPSVGVRSSWSEVLGPHGLGPFSKPGAPSITSRAAPRASPPLANQPRLSVPSYPLGGSPPVQPIGASHGLAQFHDAADGLLFA